MHVLIWTTGYFLFFLTAMKPTLTQLTRMKTTTGEKIKIIESVSPQWKKLGDLLNFDPEGRTLELFEANNYLNGVVACCREMFVTWLKAMEGRPPGRCLLNCLMIANNQNLPRKSKLPFTSIFGSLIIIVHLVLSFLNTKTLSVCHYIVIVFSTAFLN